MLAVRFHEEARATVALSHRGRKSQERVDWSSTHMMGMPRTEGIPVLLIIHERSQDSFRWPVGKQVLRLVPSAAAQEPHPSIQLCT